MAVIVSAGWYLVLVELWPEGARPYIGGSQHNSIVELALGYNGFGRLTGNEPGGLGNMNFDVGWGRLFGHIMGTEIAWLLPAAVICLGAIVVLDRRAPRTDPTRTAMFIWGGWLLVTAVVFSFMNGIVHPVLHGGTRACDRRVGGHRRKDVVAEAVYAGMCDRFGGRSSRHFDPGVRAVGAHRHVAALAEGRDCGRGSGSGRAAADVRPTERHRCALGGLPGGRGVSRGTRGVLGCDGGYSAPRGDTYGGPGESRCDATRSRRAA